MARRDAGHHVRKIINVVRRNLIELGLFVDVESDGRNVRLTPADGNFGGALVGARRTISAMCNAWHSMRE